MATCDGIARPVGTELASSGVRSQSACRFRSATIFTASAVIHQYLGKETESEDEIMDTEFSKTKSTGNPPALSPWLTVAEAADRARCGVKTIYREVRAGRLKAARVGGRRELRLLPEWIDIWLTTTTTIQ